MCSKLPHIVGIQSISTEKNVLSMRVMIKSPHIVRIHCEKKSFSVTTKLEFIRLVRRKNVLSMSVMIKSPHIIGIHHRKKSLSVTVKSEFIRLVRRKMC